MAISSYSELKQRILQWADRNDPEVSDRVDDFIDMVEAYVSRVMRVPAMEKRAILKVAKGQVTIPFDFVGLRRLVSPGGPSVSTLEYLSWDLFVDMTNQPSTDNTIYYSRQGSTWYLYPAPADGDVINCHYHAYLPPLNTQNPVNWLLEMSPQAYLYGALAYLFEFIYNEERAQYWNQKFMAELESIQLLADRTEWSGSIIQIRSR